MITQPDDTVIVGCKMCALSGESNAVPNIPDVDVQGATPGSERSLLNLWHHLRAMLI